jgi:hypothetical protein
MSNVTSTYECVTKFGDAYDKGMGWAAKNASVKDLEDIWKYLRTTRRGMALWQQYNPSADLFLCDKSILTILVRQKQWCNPTDLSPLDAFGFILGAVQWRLLKNRARRKQLHAQSAVRYLHRLSPVPKAVRAPMDRGAAQGASSTLRQQ